MKHRLASPLVLLAAVLAGCRGHSLPPGSVSLPKLPGQGLINESRGGVALRDMRGRQLLWLPRFAVYPVGAATAAAAYNFRAARLRPPLLHGPKGWYRLDAARHALLPVTDGRLPLANGATVLTGRAGTYAVEQNGRVALRGSIAAGSFRILSSKLVQSGTTLLDVETKRRRKLPPGCLTAGFHGRTLVLACGVARAAEAAAPLRLKEIVPGGAVRPLTPALAQLVPEAASLSPDGAWVAVEGDTGCAASYVYVAPAAGGVARIIYGRSTTKPFAANYSILLGWNPDGRLVVQITLSPVEIVTWG